MAIKANLVIDQGTTFTATIDVTDANNVVFDLTGYTVKSQMRKNYASSTADATFTCTHDDDGGEITLTLPSSNTVNLTPGRYLYDVEMTSSEGVITRVVEGLVTVTAGITRI